jgi:hypothetical protein
MTKEEAWYILRAETVMAQEGQSVSAHSTEPGDDEIVEEALRLAGDRLADHDRWVFRNYRELPIKEED